MDTTLWAGRTAIDMHTHVHVSMTDESVNAANRDYLQAAGAYFGTGPMGSTLPEIEAYYRRLDMACVVFSVDTETADGRIPVPAEEIAAFAADHADIVIPFASVDPWQGARALRRTRQLVDLGMRGFKFHPSTQGFYPNDRRFYPIYEIIEAARLPVVFHTGQTGIGAGMRGGAGIRLKYSNPMLLDDLAADFPDLTIIMAHPSVPWQDEGLAIAMHKPNVHIDLSGWSPKYFEAKLVRYMRRLLADKVLFGSDFPALSPERWIADFDGLGMEDALREKVLRSNALRLLQASGDGTSPAAGEEA